MYVIIVSACFIRMVAFALALTLSLYHFIKKIYL